MISLTGRPNRGSYDLIVVSPHMDDAAYSAGGRIAQARSQQKRVLVVTLFGPGTRGQPPASAAQANTSSPASASRGAADVVADVKASLFDYTSRCEEERAALEALDVDSLWLDQPELIFRKHSPAQLLRLLLPIWSLPWSQLHDVLDSMLAALCDAHLADSGSILFPLAVGFHPDHRVACDVGLALHARDTHRVEFYEDIPYTHSGPLRALRLRSLGLPAALALLTGTNDITRTMFRASKLLRFASYLPLVSYLLLLAVVQRMLSLRDLAPHVPAPQKSTHDIANVIDTKVTAMQLYPSQTSMFFGEGAEVYVALRREGRFEEHSWSFAKR